MDNQLKKLISEIKRSEIRTEHIKDLRLKQAALSKRKKELETTLSSKFEDLEKLSKPSLIDAIKKVSAKKDNLLESIKYEYLNVSIEYNAVKASKEKVDFELDILVKNNKSVDLLKDNVRDFLFLNERNFHSDFLLEYRHVVDNIRRNIELSVEMEEAIAQGAKINEKMISAITYLEEVADELKERYNSRKKIIHYSLDKLEDYQDYIIQINHNFFLFETELNDVYRIILEDKDYRSNYLEEFMSNYKLNLLSDLSKKDTLNGSLLFLKKYNDLIESINNMLKSDLVFIQNKIVELEEKEDELFEKLKSY